MYRVVGYIGKNSKEIGEYDKFRSAVSKALNGYSFFDRIVVLDGKGSQVAELVN